MSTRFIFVLAMLLSSQIQGQSWISGGDFPTNTINFSSDLVHLPSCTSGPGTYCITTQGWQGSDHSSPSNYMMKVDGNLQSTANDIIWSGIIHNIPAGNYEFSFWCLPRSSSHHIEVDVLIDQNVVGRFSQTTSGWKQFNISYSTSVPLNSLNITLKQMHFGHYTDWDLDDLSFLRTDPIATTISQSYFGAEIPDATINTGTVTVGTIVSKNQDTISHIDTLPQVAPRKPPFINVFPNPVVEDITLQVDSAFFPYTFAVHDFAGRVVYLEENISVHEHHPDLRHLPKAVFIARIICRKEIEWKGRLIRQ